ncbi:ATP-dependent RNA helicase RhlB [Motiliproteus coralliicola]|uniref:ATP-dependent RNA helicase RhlB n=1 Tax=Motiliproteus coralliicola TaxID=2283196 RepID=A0A369WUL0_9GAMM|nr:ATP-dependent RNA helicase RhlB [Motiliproteus coralliicola]
MFKWLSKSKSTAEVPSSSSKNESASRQRPNPKASKAGRTQPADKKTKPTKQRSKATSAKPKSNWNPDQFVVAPQADKVRFHDLDLPDTVMHAIADLGFQYCTPIQAQTLVHTLEGKDLIGKAQTGTGKTAAFLISIITDLIDYPIGGRRPNGKPRALVVAPTRELVMQIASDAEGLIQHSGMKVVTLVGGMDYEKQQRQLRQNQIDILVATPGRLLDFNQKGEVDLSGVEVLVLDEADRMLSMGFIPDVRAIIRSTPHKKDRQTLLFSATFSDQIMHLASLWTLDAVTVEIESEQLTADTVEQIVYLVGEQDKFNLLYNLVRQQELERVMVFANRRDQTRRLTERLKRSGVETAMLSGEVSQGQRVKTLEAFRSGRIKVLVATDVAGRGIHVDGVSHVINYNLPEDPEDYVHRIGRTGRAGAEGISYSFACETDAFMLPDIEELIGRRLPCQHPEEKLLESPR